MLLNSITPFLPSTLLYIKIIIINQGQKSCPWDSKLPIAISKI